MAERGAAQVFDDGGQRDVDDPTASVLIASEYALFAQVGRARRVEAGDQLFRRGDLGTSMFVIASGAVRLDFGEDLVAGYAEGLRTGVDGWLDDDLAFVKPWGFEPSQLSVPVFVWQGSEDLMVPIAHGQWLLEENRRFIVDNALYWVTEYHLDGLRLDATDQIHDFSARHILEELTTAVHRQAEALGRRILVIGETALNDPRWVRPVERGGFGMDAQWLDDFHHALRTAIDLVFGCGSPESPQAADSISGVTYPAWGWRTRPP